MTHQPNRSSRQAPTSRRKITTTITYLIEYTAIRENAFKGGLLVVIEYIEYY